LQHSPIASTEIREREAFYGRMIWLFDEQAARAAGRISIVERANYVAFGWTHARRSLVGVQRELWLQLDADRVLGVRKLFLNNPPAAGWGHVYSVADFVERITTMNPPASFSTVVTPPAPTVRPDPEEEEEDDDHEEADECWHQCCHHEDEEAECSYHRATCREECGCVGQ